MRSPHDSRSREAANDAMERYSAGDDTAFAVLYDAIAPRVHRFALRFLSDSFQAEDVVQNTLLRIHEARGQFVRGSEVMPWAYAIARNLALDALRRRRREGLRQGRAQPATDEPTFDSAPDEALIAVETEASLRATFAALPPSQQRAYWLVRSEGLSLREAATRLATSVTAVKLRIHRAVGSLRRARSVPTKNAR